MILDAPMRIAIAQINTILGDFSFNRKKIVDYCHQAKKQNCDLVVFPELSLMGYLPMDLLERGSVVEAQLKEFAQLQKELPSGLNILLGLITPCKAKKGKPFYNSAALVCKGKKPRFFHKELLPTYDVFDEARHLEKGNCKKNFFTFRGKRILVTICEDIWGWELPDHPSNYLSNPLLGLKGEKVDLILNMSASPFTKRKRRDRHFVTQKTALLFKAPLIYTNLVGAQDEIIFDGASFAIDKKGQLLTQSPGFTEDLNIIDFFSTTKNDKPKPKATLKSSATETLKDALVIGLRDYVLKTGFQKVHLGLSGGIDSAVVACLAVEALGPQNIVGFTLPGPFNDPLSLELAEQLASNLKIQCLNAPIGPSYELAIDELKKAMGDFSFGIVNENLQARLRGLYLMAYSNKENSLLLSTGNKSEYATGYSTLYGDMCGGLAPIGDLTKSEVYTLAEFYNRKVELIPKTIITRPPSAELRPNQKDQDSLPPYHELDASVVRLIEQKRRAKTETDRWLLEKIYRSEFKRWQAPPILKVSQHAFGRGRRFPLAHKAKT